MSSWKKTLSATVLSLLLSFATTSVASATCASGAQTCSTKYQVNEAFFGSGGELNACSSGSTGYCSKQSAGELGVGKTCSTGYCAQAGFNTDRTPSLTFVVNDSSIDLGVLTAGTPKVATATFSVKSYLASGYVVTTASDPPQNGSYLLKTPATPTGSNPSTEQFGINLVANSCPAGVPSSGQGSCSGTLGANPQQVPDSSFSFGAAANAAQNAGDGNYYNQANTFAYKKGDVVAYSDKSSGETDYTISYLFNISNVTPGGTYTMNHVLVATSTF